MHTQATTLPPNAHILVIKMAGIGDLLLATPALRALRESYPEARIDLLVTPASAGLLNGWEVLDNIIVLDKYLFDYPQQILKNPRNLARLTALWQNLRNGHYDAVLLLHHLTLPFGRFKHQLLLRATGAKWRVGLDNGHGWFLNVQVKDEGFGARHEAEYNLALAEAVGATTSDKRLTVPISEEEHRQAWQLLYEHEPPDVIQHPIIAMHPGSGNYSTAVAGPPNASPNWPILSLPMSAVNSCSSVAPKRPNCTSKFVACCNPQCQYVASLGAVISKLLPPSWNRLTSSSAMIRPSSTLLWPVAPPPSPSLASPTLKPGDPSFPTLLANRPPLSA